MWQGLFYERFELNDFPFDAQDLTFSLAMNVRVDGQLGCKLRIADNVDMVLEKTGFLLAHRRSLHGHEGSQILYGAYNQADDAAKRRGSGCCPAC